MLAGRTVMITVARDDDKAIRVCIIPKKAKDDENPALTTPLSYTGTPEELDAELGMLIYQDASAAFVTLHDVQGEKTQAPYLGPRQPLTTAFLRTLAGGLGSRITPEILPANVLVRTPDSIVW